MLKRLAIFLLAFTILTAQKKDLLLAGPMIGNVQMRSATVWLQTTKPAKVKIKYYNSNNPKNIHWTKEYSATNPANTYHITLPYLEPGQTYEYEVFINNKKQNFPYKLQVKTQPLWQWRTDPPNFTIATGSCLYINDSTYDRPGKPYGRHSEEIIKKLTEENPDVMLWLGDNVYYREADWTSLSGMIYRYTYYRKQDYMQKFLANTIHIAIWDDHDFGPNDSDGSFWNKENSLKVFKWFWANPSYGFSDNPGAYTFYQYGDVDIFLLDNRYYRTANDRLTGEKTMLGEKQFEWLINALKSSRAPFKLVAIGSQVLNPVAKYENYAATYENERRKLIETIIKENISGVIFLTGDRHHTELTKLKKRGFYPLYDLTVSPLSSKAYDSTKEGNYLRVPNTMVATQNYALLQFYGKRKNRKMKIIIKDWQGQVKWTKEISAKELKP